MDTGKVWFVMPAFREARVIASTLAQFRETGFNVVVVDDGSDDDTGEIAHRNGAWVCRHVVNLGAGAALQTGLEFALRNGADYLVTFDADGQHQLDDAVVMLSVLRSGGVDVVLGSRFLGTTEGKYEQHLINTLGPIELWALSTSAEDVAIRSRLYKKIGAGRARQLLASIFPGGSARNEIKRRVLMRADSGEAKAAAASAVIEEIVDELVVASEKKLSAPAEG